MKTNTGEFGTAFERYTVSILSIITGFLLIYLAVMGPLWLNKIKYMTADIVNYQLAGQDIVNLVLLSVISIAGGVTLLLKKEISKYLLISTPFYLIYFVLSYGAGMEWSSSKYTGNSHLYTYHFLFILISALIILLYSLSIFPKNVKSTFKKKSLIIYTVIYTIFLVMFAMMWMQEINQVIATGTSRGYEIAPTAFWVVRYFDLGFSIPLGLISIYLLWTRPDTTYHVQFLFYGFFITMVTAVNSMALFMYFNNDPTFELSSSLVFLVLAAIIYSGFIYVVRNYKRV